MKSSTALVSWPVLGVALQKNYISLYNSVSVDGRPFTVGYSGCLGRARVSSKGVVTFTSRDDLNLEALADMIAALEAGLAAGELIVG